MSPGKPPGPQPHWGLGTELIPPKELWTLKGAAEDKHGVTPGIKTSNQPEAKLQLHCKDTTDVFKGPGVPTQVRKRSVPQF